MISQLKSFPYQDKQGTLEEGQRIQRLKYCVTNNNNKDEENSQKKKNHKIFVFYLKFYEIK